jgi:hypothetical protein
VKIGKPAYTVLGLLVASCATYQPVVPGRPMSVASQGLGRSVVIQDGALRDRDSAIQELVRVDASEPDARAASALNRWGWASWVAGGAVVGFALGMVTDPPTGWSPGPGVAVGAGGLCLLAGGVWAWHAATDHLSDAASRYDATLSAPPRPTSARVQLGGWASMVEAAHGTRAPAAGVRASF